MTKPGLGLARCTTGKARELICGSGQGLVTVTTISGSDRDELGQQFHGPLEPGVEQPVPGGAGNSKIARNECVPTRRHLPQGTAGFSVRGVKK